jgi:hypothetical protein
MFRKFWFRKNTQVELIENKPLESKKTKQPETKRTSTVGYEAIFSSKFGLIEFEIDRIRSKLEMKSDGLFFESHEYSRKEIMALANWNKIHRIADVIRTDVESWIAHENLPPDGQSAYHAFHRKYNDALTELEYVIMNRKSSFYDRVVESIEYAVKIITALRNALPAIMSYVGINLRLLNEILRLQYLPYQQSSDNFPDIDDPDYY